MGDDLERQLTRRAEEARARQAARAAEDRADRDEWLVKAAVVVGPVLATLGLIDGLEMALKRTVAPCPDSQFFPAGAKDLNFYIHPQGGVGGAVIFVSMMMAILIVFGGALLTIALRGRRADV